MSIHASSTGAASAVQPPSILLASPLMAATRHLERPAVVRVDGSRSWAQVHAMSLELAGRLTGTGPVVNLCASRLGFLVTWLAALRLRRPMWLPPSSGPADGVDALQDLRSHCLVVDADEDVAHGGPLHTHRVVRGPQSFATRSDFDPADLGWQPCWDATAAVLHTSGSTGQPTAHRKTLLQLALGALALGERLWPKGMPPESEHLLSSVAPSHMFGFEASVMLPLVYGLPVFERRPLLAADVAEAFAATSAACLWIATPMHLRGLVRSGTSIARCAGVLSSTMPLSTDTATRVQALLGARVLEVYGSTETGALATRLTAHETDWWPLPGVFLRPCNGMPRSADPPWPWRPQTEPQVQVQPQSQLHHLAFGTHFDSPVRLTDRIEMSTSGRLDLLGRDGDLLKIGGHRASLSALNLLLLEMPGLRDGVLFLPAAAGHGTEAVDVDVAAPDSGVTVDRLCLVYCSDMLDRDRIEHWWRHRVAPAFMPRTFIRVDRLPRDPRGKARQAALDALHRQWLCRDGEFHVSVAADHPCLPGHFPGRPLVPGVLLLEAMLSGLSTRTGRIVDRIEQARFVRPWLPGEVASVRFEIDAQRCRLDATVVRSGRRVTLAMLDGRCAPLLQGDPPGAASAAAAPTEPVTLVACAGALQS